jgi:hypothetical protein
MKGILITFSKGTNLTVVTYIHILHSMDPELLKIELGILSKSQKHKTYKKIGPNTPVTVNMTVILDSVHLFEFLQTVFQAVSSDVREGMVPTRLGPLQRAMFTVCSGTTE